MPLERLLTRAEASKLLDVRANNPFRAIQKWLKALGITVATNKAINQLLTESIKSFPPG